MIIPTGVKSNPKNPRGPDRDMSRYTNRPMMTVGTEYRV
jgi:hypothetical protein